jgi:hypothetical protein
MRWPPATDPSLLDLRVEGLLCSQPGPRAGPVRGFASYRSTRARVRAMTMTLCALCTAIPMRDRRSRAGWLTGGVKPLKSAMPQGHSWAPPSTSGSW